jgi:hypothetical protein
LAAVASSSPHDARKLKVGVLAINTTAEEFSAKLKDFKLSEVKK